MLALFATVSENGVIGRGGKPPFDFPEMYTQMHCICRQARVILGAGTYRHLKEVGQLPVAKRIVVLSRTGIVSDASDAPAIYAVVPTLGKAIAKAGDGHIVIIGGEEVYREAMPIADRLVLTHVHSHATGNVRFPEFSLGEWKKSGAITLSPGHKNPVPLEFAIYERLR